MDIPENAKRLDSFLNSLSSKNIKLKKEEVKEVNTYLQENVLDEVVKELKASDATFKELFVQKNYVGSFYENLRVGDPNEFDINFELKLPISDSDIVIETCTAQYDFAKIKVDKIFYQHVTPEVRNKISSWLEEGYINRDKVYRWFQRIVDIAILKVTWLPNLTVNRQTCGPAITLNVKYKNKEFSVDLVPVFTYGCGKWPSEPLRQLDNIPREIDSEILLQKWCVVPKAPKIIPASSHEWRMSFYSFEKKITKGLNHMNPVIKIMKFLRDNKNWVNLSSYYIKTLFLWEKEEKKHEPMFWRQSKGYLFMHMLNRLLERLEERKIEFFWDKRNNLIANLNEIPNMCGELRRLRNKLNIALGVSDEEEFTNKLEEIFKPSQSKPQQQQEKDEDLYEEDLYWSEERHSYQTTQMYGETSSEESPWIGLAVGIGTLAILGGALAYGLSRRRNNNNN